MKMVMYLKEEHFSNGIKEGLFEEFNENGAIKVNECFEMGKKIELINCNDI